MDSHNWCLYRYMPVREFLLTPIDVKTHRVGSYTGT